MRQAAHFGQNGKMWNLAGLLNSSAEAAGGRPDRYMLWIDGAGGYLVCLGERVSIGGPSLDENSADVPLLASLSRKHATIVRSREGYVLDPHSTTRVGNRPVEGAVYLNSGYTIELGNSVRLRFWLPTVLSATAVLEFVSDHRPCRSVDGVILMEETCLIGPGRENHVRCPEWPESVVLYRSGEDFCCKSRCDLFAGTRRLAEGEALRPGDVVTGNDAMRFRIEAAAL
jgi:hypothetical protein